MTKTRRLAAIALALSSCSRSHDATGNVAAANALADAAAEDRSTAIELGKVTIGKPNGQDAQVLYDGKPLNPPIEGSQFMSIVHVYDYAAKALYVVQDIEGTACPVTYYVVEVTAARASATKEFGSCSEHVKIAEVPGGLTFRMPGYTSPESAEMDPSSSDDAEHVFTYRNGQIAERKIEPKSSVRVTPAWLVGYWVGAPKPTANLECGTDTGVRFNRDGTFYDGGHRGRFRTNGKSVSYYDRVTIDEGAGTESREDFGTPETNAIRADGPNAFIEAGNRYQRCKGGG